MAQFSNMAEAPKNQQWSTGLYDCCNDWYVCGQSNYCLYGENVRKLTGAGFCGPCCLMFWCGYFSCCFANTTRADIRAKYGLPAEPCGDCVVHWCCSPCAICQEARELRVRDGWKTWHD